MAIPTKEKELPEKTLKKIAENLLICSDHTTKQVLLFMSVVEKDKIEQYMRENLALASQNTVDAEKQAPDIKPQD